jgi:Protein of unknown function (DUF3892)
MIEITAVSFGQAKAHEHITAVLWRSASTPAGHSAREAIVAWLQASSANQAVVADGSEYVQVLVVCPANHRPYIRTQLDGVWTDNLLALPVF